MYFVTKDIKKQWSERASLGNAGEYFLQLAETAETVQYWNLLFK